MGEWKEPIHGDALLESRELIADESDEEDEEEPVKSRVTETRNKKTDKESSDNNAVQTEESSADGNKTNINGDKKCNESESTDEDEIKRINSEEEKLDRDLTQRLMAKYWKPR